jgi:hypothetical protein
VLSRIELGPDLERATGVPRVRHCGSLPRPACVRLTWFSFGLDAGAPPDVIKLLTKESMGKRFTPQLEVLSTSIERPRPGPYQVFTSNAGRAASVAGEAI